MLKINRLSRISLRTNFNSFGVLQQRWVRNNSLLNGINGNIIKSTKKVKSEFFKYNGIYNNSFIHRFSTSTIRIPNMGDSISEGTLVQWNKKIGDYCKMDEVIAVVETDKVSVDIRVDQAGVLVEQMAKINDTLQVGASLCKIDTSASPPSSSNQKESPKQDKKLPDQSKNTDIPPKKPIDVSSAPSKKPVEQSKEPSQSPKKDKEKSSASSPKEGSSAPKSSTPRIIFTPNFSRSSTPVTMSRMRQRIAQRLKEAQNTAASLTTFNEIDMSNIMKIRNTYKDLFFEKHNVKFGFMSVFVKAAVSALQDQPAVNAYIEGKEIIYHDYCDVSVAVASPNGLVVPVIRNAESLSFAEVERKIQEYSQKAKQGSLTLEEMSGGTFTISNGGVFGSLMGTPIINPPQSAILGMHGIFDRPIAVAGKVEIRPMMYIALTYDHRIIDGREAVLFLRRIKDCIEDPSRLLLDV